MHKLCGGLALILIWSFGLFSQTLSNPVRTNKASSANTITLKAVGQGEEVRARIPPLSLPGGRLIVTVGNAIYMIARDGKVSWHYSELEEVNSQPVFRPDRNEIAIVGSGLNLVRLDAITGKVLWSTYGDGSAAFVDLEPYGPGYLVLVDMSGYREKSEAMGDTNFIPDRLDYWGEAETDNWSVDFPVGAHLAVAGSHIYAVEYQKTSITLQEIQPGSPKK